jgi:hypothetical protein
MSDLQTPKQRANSILPLFGAIMRGRRPRHKQALGARAASAKLNHERTIGVDPEPLLGNQSDRLFRVLRQAEKQVFKKIGLDSKSRDNRDLVLMLLAWAIYGKNPGHPRVWTKQKLRQLHIAIGRAKSLDAKLTELECCKKLIKEGQYEGSPQTLRRRLQQAKKLRDTPKKSE